MQVIDLTMQIYDGMEVYEGDPEVKIEVVHGYESHSWKLNRLEMGSHTGTHVDVFSHMHRDKETLDDIPIDRFFGKSQRVSLLEEYPIGKGLFFIEKVDIMEFDKLIKAKPSFIGGNITEALERKLLKNNVLCYTNLINLDKLPKGTDFMFYGLPLRIKEGDGSPVRAIAILLDE